MIKLAGAICVLAGCAYAGFAKSIQMRRREEWLLNMRAFLNMLDIQIQFSSDRLERCMRMADKHIKLGRFLTYAADHIKTDGIQCAWAESVRINTPYLTDEDREVITVLGARLGMTDRENQYKNICYTKELIQKQYEQAHDLRRRVSRLYEGGGILAGVFVVLMLI